MQIKDLDALEILLNEIGVELDQIKSLSAILSEGLCNEQMSNLPDIQNLTSVLNEKIIDLKEKFSMMAKDLYI